MNRPRVRRLGRPIVLLVAPIVLLVAACGDDEGDTAAPAATAAPADSMTDESMSEDSMTGDSMTGDSMTGDSMTGDSMTGDSMTGDSMSEESMSGASMTEESMSGEAMSEESMADLPAYQTLTITDVDGVSFTLHELAGTPVVVEAFATWCPSCRAQLATTNEAAAALGDTAEVLALSVETDVSSADVAAYAAENGFDDIRFAVITPEMLAALVDSFGNSIANPPSTPKFVLDPMGHASELTTGAESVDEIVAAVQSTST